MSLAASTPASEVAPTLKLLTCNLQVGIHTSAYHHYFTRSWQHLLPHPKRSSRLDVVASTLSAYDIVGLQEVDGGSFRSSHVNQVEYLAKRSAFDFHFQQLNRNLGHVAQHSNGLLSRLMPNRVDEHRLPGMRGRGAIHARYGEGPDALHVFVAHLALSQRGRLRQLDYLGEIIEYSSDGDRTTVAMQLDPFRPGPASRPKGGERPVPAFLACSRARCQTAPP